MRVLITRGLIAAALAGAVLAAVATSAPAQPTKPRPASVSFGTTGMRAGRAGLLSHHTRASTPQPSPSMSFPFSCTTFCRQAGIPLTSGPGLGLGIGLITIFGGLTLSIYLRRRRSRMTA
jgi:hypothetical protein